MCVQRHWAAVASTVPAVSGVRQWPTARNHVAAAHVEGVSREGVVVLCVCANILHVLQLVHKDDWLPVRHEPHLRAQIRCESREVL